MYDATRLDADARSTKTGRPFGKIVVGQGDGFSGDADEILVEFAVAVFVVINQQGIITGRQAIKSVTSVGRGNFKPVPLVRLAQTTKTIGGAINVAQEPTRVWAVAWRGGTDGGRCASR